MKYPSLATLPLFLSLSCRCPPPHPLPPRSSSSCLMYYPNSAPVASRHCADLRASCRASAERSNMEPLQATHIKNMTNELETGRDESRGKKERVKGRIGIICTPLPLPPPISTHIFVHSGYCFIVLPYPSRFLSTYGVDLVLMESVFFDVECWRDIQRLHAQLYSIVKCFPTFFCLTYPQKVP